MIIATVRDKDDRQNFKKDPTDLEFMEVKSNMIEDGMTSSFAFREIQESMMKDGGKNLLVYVHGFNNTHEDTIRRGLAMEKNFNVNLLMYTWPSADALHYSDTKRRARIAAEGFDRLMIKFETLIKGLQPEQRCNKKLTLMPHSRGNYLVKQWLKQSERNRFPFFNNIILCQADVNNYDHDLWVDKLRFLDNLYVTINNRDYALGVSTAKGGESQKRRLGKYEKNLSSKVVQYINMSDWDGMGFSHAPFSTKRIDKCEQSKVFFNQVLNGEKPKGLTYQAHGNYFE